MSLKGFFVVHSLEKGKGRIRGDKKDHHSSLEHN